MSIVLGWFLDGKDRGIGELGIVSYDFWVAANNCQKDVYYKVLQGRSYSW